MRGQGKADYIPQERPETLNEDDMNAPGLVEELRDDTMEAAEPAAPAPKKAPSFAKIKPLPPSDAEAPGLVSLLDHPAPVAPAMIAGNKLREDAHYPLAVPAAKNENPLRQLVAFGQSVWYDNIDRTMLENGELTRLIDEDDLRGITSNPSIFQKAFAGDAYDAALRNWLDENPGGSARDAYYSLAIDDIRRACDLLLPVYEKTGGTDGMVSLEVSPDLAHDSSKTVTEALELHRRVARENLMIKIPATLAGIKAIRELTAEGININATLIFSPERYRQTLEAYIDGLKTRVAAGQSIDLLRSVASYFVSRVDSKIDARLADEHAALRGRAAIANAQTAYSYYLERISHDDWADLAKKGAAVQRLLWASTGTKNPAYSDVRYVELLIGRDTVNTIPPATYAAYKAHGRAEKTLLRHIDQAPQLLQQITDAGIDWAQLYVELEAEGIASFEQATAELLATLAAKIKTLREAKPGDAAADADNSDKTAEAVAETPAAETTADEAPAAPENVAESADRDEAAGDTHAAAAETPAEADSSDETAEPVAETPAENIAETAGEDSHAEAAPTEPAAETSAENENADAPATPREDLAANADDHAETAPATETPAENSAESENTDAPGDNTDGDDEKRD